MKGVMPVLPIAEMDGKPLKLKPYLELLVNIGKLDRIMYTSFWGYIYDYV